MTKRYDPVRGRDRSSPGRCWPSRARHRLRGLRYRADCYSRFAARFQLVPVKIQTLIRVPQTVGLRIRSARIANRSVKQKMTANSWLSRGPTREYRTQATIWIVA